MLAALVPIVPWTVHNYHELDRVVPLSTGSGKALFTGTYYPGDGEYQQVKAELYFQQTGNRLDPGSAELEAVDPVPLFDRVANEYKAANNLPDLDRDDALGRLGKENLKEYLGDHPVGFVGMTFRKVGRMWSSGVGDALLLIGRAIDTAGPRRAGRPGFAGLAPALGGDRGWLADCHGYCSRGDHTRSRAAK